MTCAMPTGSSSRVSGMTGTGKTSQGTSGPSEPNNVVRDNSAFALSEGSTDSTSAAISSTQAGERTTGGVFPGASATWRPGKSTSAGESMLRYWKA